MTEPLAAADLRRDARRPWRVWDLDLELRYRPVVAALPISANVVCEVGSGPRGLAAWTDRPVIGIDPTAEQDASTPPNLRVVRGDGSQIPLEDGSADAAVAVDTLEHVPPPVRPDVISEMVRVTAGGGRVILNGPAGPVAAAGDRRLAKQYRRVGTRGNSAHWLAEHLEYGPPAIDELRAWLHVDRVAAIRVEGVFNVHLWYVMHLVALGVLPSLGPAHRLVWGPFAALARRYQRGPCYRRLVVADVRGAT